MPETVKKPSSTSTSRSSGYVRRRQRDNVAVTTVLDAEVVNALDGWHQRVERFKRGAARCAKALVEGDAVDLLERRVVTQEALVEHRDRRCRTARRDRRAGHHVATERVGGRHS